MIFQDNFDLKECIDFSNQGKNQIIFGLNQGEKSFFAGLYNKKTVIVASDFVAANAYKNQLNAMGKSAEIISVGIESPVFVYWQDLTQINAAIKNLTNFFYGNLDVLVLLPEALFLTLPNKELFAPLKLEKGKNYNFSALASELIKMGYTKQVIVSGEGEFAFRGDILDIFITGHTKPIRVNFFDDEIEGLHTFALDDMSKLNDLESVEINANTIFFRENGDQIIQNLKADFVEKKILTQREEKFNQTLQNVIEAVETNPNNLNLAFTTVYDERFKHNILSFLTGEHFLFLDEPKKLLQTLDLVEINQNNSTLKLFEDGLLSQKHFKFYFDKTKVFKTSATSVVFSSINSTQSIIVPQKASTFNCLASTKYVFDYKLLVDDIKRYALSKFKVVLYAGDKASQERIKEFLQINKIMPQDESKIDFLFDGVFVLDNYLFQSVAIMETKTVLIATEDLIKRKTSVLSSKKKSVFYLPKVGEYVVHEFHGIGKCVAIERLKLGGLEKDYFVLEYDKGDKIYIPTEQANSISAYIGSETQPKLNKLGGLEFARVKEKARKSIEEFAINLMELYAKRKAQKGFKFEADSYLEQSFNDAFIYEETPDQMQAIIDTKNDMTSEKIMDRLICGDVGYGKTEVAMRAAYKAVLSGKQVAVLCPTTILAEQHFKTFSNRFKDFVVNVARINRLVTPSHQKQYLKNLKEGKIDIIIGTHRLLADDVKFKDIGLLILDEEQRFGVQDKEKIKEFKKNIDVLTLSATPIPRTLHMSLTGIRDISIIETPPKNRVAVQTFVTEFDWGLVEMAVNRELGRNGQVYIVYNRVETIDEFAKNLQEVFPKIKIGVAHGQMDRKALEDTVLSLYNGEYQVLVATTLIENGIDIPSANTIIIVDADKLGLSSLYQLKGRVGRSGKIAYAYFTFQKNKVLSSDAMKRLQAISEFSSLGSGFKIAMRDLEIRGAGSVLGNKQHGHIEKVGYDLYSKILQEVLEELKGNKQSKINPIKMDVSVSAFLPETFVPDENQRIKLYTDISLLSSKAEMETLLYNTTESYGKVPQEVVNLCLIALIKNICQKHGVKTVVVNKDRSFLQLYKKEEILDSFLAKALEKNKHLAVLKFEQLPIIEFEKTAASPQNMLGIIADFLTQD